MTTSNIVPAVRYKQLGPLSQQVYDNLWMCHLMLGTLSLQITSLVCLLPPNGNNAIAVFVDKLTKYVYAVPCSDTSDAIDWANMYVEHAVQHEKLSVVMISDRDP